MDSLENSKIILEKLEKLQKDNQVDIKEEKLNIKK